MVASNYRRTPLPKYAQTPTGWIALCAMGVIFSPFAGFAIHGKVDESGLAVGLTLAVLPLTGLFAIALRRWYVWRTLPRHIAEEWKSGRVIQAVGAPSVDAPVRFRNGKNWIELRPEGFAFSRHTFLSMQGSPHSLAQRWVADHTGESFIAWQDIAEWIVATDSDAPDYYLLKLVHGGMVKFRRFRPDSADECAVLDAIRSVGKLPVTLCCDVECNY